MRVRMTGATDIGRRRKNNQDSIFYDEVQGLGIVADGIGGRKGGEVASSMVVNGLRKAFQAADNIKKEEISSFLVNQIDRANLSVVERGRREAEVHGMGTTLNCIVFNNGKIHIAHVGDSRTYLYYKKHVYQLTLDHSVGNFLERGWLPKSAVAPGAKEGALVRAIGLTDRCDVDLYEMKLKPGQLFITCSDGLSGMISDRQMAKLISEHIGDWHNLSKVLIDAANAAGGRDNITVVLSQVTEE